MQFENNILESFIPLALASITPNEKDKQRILKLGELCEKYKCKFSSVHPMLVELAKWEESQADV